MPALRKSASTAESELAIAPVCEVAARLPAHEAPRGLDPGPRVHDSRVGGVPVTFPSLLRAAKIIKSHPNLYAVYVTNFGCGPDSFITHFFKKIMEGKPFLQLEIDEHSADEGLQRIREDRRPFLPPAPHLASSGVVRSGARACTSGDFKCGKLFSIQQFSRDLRVA